MTKASDNEFPSVLFDEQASAPTTPASGFWRAYFKSDGMYVVDDAGNETGPFGAGGAGDFTSTTNPELVTPAAGTPISMAGATAGTGVTANDLGDGLTEVQFTNASHQHWDVSQALGTGNFDVRARIVAANSLSVAAATDANGYGGLCVTDSSRTAATRLIVALTFHGHNTSADTCFVQGMVNASFVGGHLGFYRLPIVLRIARSGTTVTMYASEDEGNTWVTLHSLTDSTDFQKVGLNAHDNTVDGRIVLHRIWTP